MSLEIETVSHGNIEGGFFGVYTSGFRFGEYAFPTQSIHMMYKYFAENLNSNLVYLASFGTDIFWKECEKHIQDLSAEIVTSLNSSKPKDLNKNLDKMIARYQARFDIDPNKMDLRSIPVELTQDETQVSMGMYAITRETFNFLAHYSLQGGWLGWNEGNFPKSATNAIAAIKKSRRPIFSEFPRK